MMARDGTIPTGKIIEMLMKLPIDSRVTTNALGNIIVYGEDKYLGYIDTHVERFYSIAELAYEMLEREDDPGEPETVESEASAEDIIPNLRKVYRNR